jgi:hypothetical protein
VLLFQFDGCPELLYKIKEAELVHKILTYQILIHHRQKCYMYCTYAKSVVYTVAATIIIAYFSYFFWEYINVPRVHPRARVPPTIWHALRCS